MHYLHKILVYIPDVDSDMEALGREEQIDKIRSYAETETERFADDVFDWREKSSSAGRWEKEYPVNVLFASDNVDRFVEELNEVIESQKIDLSIWVSLIKKRVGTDLNEIVDHLFHNEPDDLSNIGYYLHCIADLLYGEYQCDSGFYNTHEYTARLYLRDIEFAKSNPNDWALVMLDYHA